MVQPSQNADADTSADEKEEEEPDVDDSEILEDWPDETEVDPLPPISPYCTLTSSEGNRTHPFSSFLCDQPWSSSICRTSAQTMSPAKLHISLRSRSL